MDGNIEQGSTSLGGLLLHHLLELLELLHLLHLLHLEEFHWVHTGGKAVGDLAGWDLSAGDLGLGLHVLAGFGADDAELLHELDDGSLHFAENSHDLRVGHDDIVTDVLHEVLFFQTVLLVDKVVEGESEQHGDELEVFGGALETGEEVLEEGNLVVQLVDLVLQDLLGLFERGFFLGSQRFPA